MNEVIVLIVLALLGLPLFLRGQELHNHLVYRAQEAFQKSGFTTYIEYLIQLPNGTLNFVDLYVVRGNCIIAVEVETRASNILSNATKAQEAGLVLWVLVPTNRVRHSVENKLKGSNLRPGGLRIYILLLHPLQQQLTNYFPLISLPNDQRENRKTNQTGDLNEL